MSSNFVLFCFFGQKFRSTLKLLFSVRAQKYKKGEKTGIKLSALKEDNFGNLSSFVNNNSSSNITKSNSVQNFLIIKKQSLRRNSSIKNDSKYLSEQKEKCELLDLNQIKSIAF